MPCVLRDDKTLRHERAERYSKSARFDASEGERVDEAVLAAMYVLRRQQMALPASALVSLVSNELGMTFKASQIEFILRTSRGIRETSPGMFKWESAEDPNPKHLFAEDFSSGASVAKMVAQHPPLPAKIRRAKLKRLAALLRLGEFEQVEVARDSITATVDRLAPRVLEREGWRISDAAAYATDGSLVPPDPDAEEANQAERRDLLVGILALETLREFDSVRESIDELRTELVLHNLGLVATMARKYARGQFLQYVDLFQSGIEGLYRAIDRYDPYLGYEFSTFALSWIRQAITRTIANEERTIRLPVHAIESLDRIRGARINIRRWLEREPSPSELGKQAGLTTQQVLDITRRGRPAVRIEDSQLESIADPRDEIGDQETDMFGSALIGILEKTLSEREILVLKSRFGLGNSEPRTLEQVGRLLGVTRERVRQIEKKALRRLRLKAREATTDFLLSV